MESRQRYHLQVVPVQLQLVRSGVPVPRPGFVGTCGSVPEQFDVDQVVFSGVVAKGDAVQGPEVRGHEFPGVVASVHEPHRFDDVLRVLGTSCHDNGTVRPESEHTEIPNQDERHG